MLIRRGRPEDLPVLRDVEVRAGAAFRAIGMHEIADDEPELLGVDATVFVAEVEGGVVGYVQVHVVDDALHVEQVSVVPEVGGRRIGAALLDRAAEHARSMNRSRLTLTTFRDVPWNAPYYERLGFRSMDEVGPELTALVEQERTAIPGDAPRVAMWRPV